MGPHSFGNSESAIAIHWMRALIGLQRKLNRRAVLLRGLTDGQRNLLIQSCLISTVCRCNVIPDGMHKAHQATRYADRRHAIERRGPVWPA